MKRKYIITFLLLLCSIIGYAQDAIFEKYADMDGVTSVFISKSMLNMMPNMKAEGVNIGEVAGKLDNIQILSTEKADIISKIRNEFNHINSRNGYEELMRVNDEGEKTTIYLKKEKNGKKEFILLNNQKKEFTIILIRGNLSMEEIKNIMN